MLEKIDEEGSGEGKKSRLTLVTSTLTKRSDGSGKAESPCSGLLQIVAGLGKLPLNTKLPVPLSPIAAAQTSPKVFRLETSFRASSPRPVSPGPASDSGAQNLSDSDLLSFSHLARAHDSNVFAHDDQDFKFEGAGQAVFGFAVTGAGNGGADVKDSEADGGLDRPEEVELFSDKATGYRLELSDIIFGMCLVIASPASYIWLLVAGSNLKVLGSWHVLLNPEILVSCQGKAISFPLKVVGTKFYFLSRYDGESKEWKNIGFGTLKIVKSQTSKYQLVLRSQVFTVAINHVIEPTMRFKDFAK